MKKLTINDLQMINKPQAKVVARTLHKIKIKAKRVIVPMLRQATLSTSKYPPRILWLLKRQNAPFLQKKIGTLGDFS